MLEIGTLSQRLLENIVPKDRVLDGLFYLR